MTVNWLATYQKNVDSYQEKGDVDYLRCAFEDTASSMALVEKMSLLSAKENLNALIPNLNMKDYRMEDPTSFLSLNERYGHKGKTFKNKAEAIQFASSNPGSYMTRLLTSNDKGQRRLFAYLVTLPQKKR